MTAILGFVAEGHSADVAASLVGVHDDAQVELLTDPTFAAQVRRAEAEYASELQRRLFDGDESAKPLLEQRFRTSSWRARWSRPRERRPLGAVHL